MKTQEPTEKTKILTAMQLGWLLVESFGRLGMYERSPQKSTRRKGDKSRPFAYSVNESLGLDELVWCVNQLHNLYQTLELSEHPQLPLLREKELIKKLESDGVDLDALQEELDAWSKTIWGLLNAKNGSSAQAFFYGGSLADTYWYTTMVWSDEKALSEFLNRYRLDYLATQCELISDDLPAYLADALANSLRRWSTVDLSAADRTKLKTRLEAQQNVWRDLLFERRRPESYLRDKHYRSIRVYSVSIQILFALFLLIIIYLAGREVGGLFPSGESKDLSGFVAALSSFVVVVSGLITQFSSWIKSTGTRAAERKKRQMILKNTFRDWRLQD